MQETNLNQMFFKEKDFTKNMLYSAEVVFLDNANRTLPIEKFQIDRDASYFSQNCSFELHNNNPVNITDIGYYSPDRQATFWTYEIYPGKKIQIRITVTASEQSETFVLFTGYIDTVKMEVTKTSTIKVTCRDSACILLDNMIPEDEYGERWLDYSNADVGEIIRDLLTKAGFAGQTDKVGNTQTVIDIEFENTTYANCIAQLTEISGYEFFFDEIGEPILREPLAASPETTDIFYFSESDTYYIEIPNLSLIVPGSEILSDNDENIYLRGFDYEIDYEKQTIKRILGSSIPTGKELHLTYLHTAYHFRQGEDIYSLVYQISRDQVYGNIQASGYGAVAQYINPNPAYYGVSGDKTLIVQDNQYLEEEEQIQDMVNRLGYTMLRTFRKVELVTVGIPYLQFGDCIQITEHSTTVSEIYRITALSFYMEKGMLYSKIRVYYYDHAPY